MLVFIGIYWWQYIQGIAQNLKMDNLTKYFKQHYEVATIIFLI